MYNQPAAAAYALELSKPPPYGSPQGVPLPGSERPGRTPVYRHWRFRDGPLLKTLDPAVRTIHDLFESSAQAFVNQPCLGTRAWLPATQTWDNKFQWMTYGQIAERRKNLGAGLVEIHKAVGYDHDKYGVGIWSQNRPEWQISGKRCWHKGTLGMMAAMKLT